jgi:NSS family neurotransmitter:Na+ symporter
MEQATQFSNRWGIIFASLGMAVGAGNLWRFPRLAGQYGGTFLLIWMLFLLIWSIPVLLAEFSIGKQFKSGVIRSFAGFAGKEYTWMGFFIALCCLCICFHYSVVAAWSLHYLGLAIENIWTGVVSGQTLSEQLAQDPDFLHKHWQHVANGNWATVGLHIFSVSLGILILWRGIQKGLERANKIMIPTLFVLLIIVCSIAVQTNNGIKGLDYMFTIRPELFFEPKVWLEALSQSAWSTGAGWGLVMTIASYSRKKEDVTLNTFISGFGDNTASLMAGMAILPAVFALAASEESAVALLQSGNQALTFMVIPSLFAQIPGGDWLAVMFFIVFFLAAYSSLLPMFELGIRLLGDLRLERKKAALVLGVACVCFGFPSAYSLSVFSNQDWVWGLGLVVSGLFLIFAVLKHGPARFKKELVDQDADFTVPTAYFKACITLNAVLGFVLIYWWMSRGYSENPWFNAQGQWNVFDIYSNATIVTQWGVLLLIGIFFNNYLYKKFHS